MSAPTIATPERLLTVPPELIPDLDQFVIEDGKPVDGILSEKQMRLLTEPLLSGWAAPEGAPFVVMADVGIFHTVGEPPIVPDVLLAVGVRQGTDLRERKNLSYFVWLRGKVPDVAVEIVSNREGGEDSSKFRTYAHIGVPCYVIFDPNDLLNAGVLRLFELQGGRYRALAEPYFLEKAGLGVRLWDGAFEGINRTWLRWCDREGTVVPTGAERAEAEHQRADQEHQRADQEKQRADQEKQRADQEKQRADQEKHRADRVESELARLLEKLREKGMESQE